MHALRVDMPELGKEGQKSGQESKRPGQKKLARRIIAFESRNYKWDNHICNSVCSITWTPDTFFSCGLWPWVIQFPIEQASTAEVEFQYSQPAGAIMLANWECITTSREYSFRGLTRYVGFVVLSGIRSAVRTMLNFWMKMPVSMLRKEIA